MRPQAVAELVRSVAAFGLAGAVRTFPAQPLDDGSWQRLLRAVRAQRLEGHLAEAVASDALPATVGQVDDAAQAHERAMHQVLRLERTLLDVIDVLAEASIASRTLKGSAYAHLSYPNPALRVFGDVDVLVTGERLDDAVAVLAAAGYHRRWPQPRPGFDRRFGKGVTLFADDGTEVDLHRTFALGPFGLKVRVEDLFERVASFPLAGRDVPALPAEERFLHTCYHAALGDPIPRLVPLRDLAQQCLVTELDVERVLALVHRWEGPAVLARAVRLAWDVLEIADVVPLSVWARRYDPSREDRRALAAYAHGRYGMKAIASLRAVPRAGDRIALLRALALPERSYLVQRGSGYSRWWRRAGRVWLMRGARG